MFVFHQFNKKVHIAPKTSYIDNIVFRMNYRITMWFLLACTVIVGSKEFIREHINCIADQKMKKVIENFCFISSTFTVIKHHNVTNGNSPIYPGVGPYVFNQDEVVRHAYYQWVPFVLFFQALLFYLPHLIWKKLENGRVRAIVDYMSISNSEEKAVDKVSKMKEYLLLRFKINRDWAVCLILCEILNVVNLVGQIIAMDKFLQGKFYDLGIQWLMSDGSNDILDLVFPKVTKCIFHKYGPTATLQVHDTICIMPLNIINEKVYFILWFWMAGLLIITSLGLLWRLLTLLLHSRSTLFNKIVWGELSPGPAIREQDIEAITTQFYFSEWLFLYYIGKNTNGKMFRNLVSQLSESLRKHQQVNHLLLQAPATPNSRSRQGSESSC